MRLSGLNIEIIRGETAAVAFTLTDPDGQPFRLLLSDMFSVLHARFKVKENVYEKNPSSFLIDKVFDLSTVKRFSDIAIINLKTYNLGQYIDWQWNESFVPEPEDIDRLFYHQDLKEYRYYDAEGTPSKWVPYEVLITVQFDIADTVNLDYRQYAYDLIIEAGNDEDVIEYVNILIEQRPFVVTYRV